jgi:hypothetical protein
LHEGLPFDFSRIAIGKVIDTAAGNLQRCRREGEGRAYLLAGKKGSELCDERAAKPVSEWERLLFLKATSTARGVGSDEE